MTSDFVSVALLTNYAGSDRRRISKVLEIVCSRGLADDKMKITATEVDVVEKNWKIFESGVDFRDGDCPACRIFHFLAVIYISCCALAMALLWLFLLHVL